MMQQPSKERAGVAVATAVIADFERAAAGGDRTYYRKSRQIDDPAAPVCCHPGAPATSRLIGPGGEYVGESDLSWTRLAEK
jgi:hypothetical protein